MHNYININYYGCQVNNLFVGAATRRQAGAEQEQAENERSAPGEKLKFDVNDAREKFLPSKLRAEQLEKLYIRIGEIDKAYQVKICGGFLEFVSPYKDFRERKLRRLNSCKRRLCPFCAWRRSLRVYANIKQVIDEIEREDADKSDDNLRSRFLFLTLTTRNVSLADLAGEVERILGAFKRLSDYKRFKAAFAGYVRALEVVIDRDKYVTEEGFDRRFEYYSARGINEGDPNPNYLMCNVHIHCLLHTTYSRYRDNYIHQPEFVALWRRALGADYDPIVDIRKFRARSRATKGKELAEVAKYSVKPGDYLGADDDVNAEIVRALEGALYGRRLLGFGGTIKEISRQLKLDYESLADAGGDDADAEKYILQYYYSSAKKQYKRINK